MGNYITLLTQSLFNADQYEGFDRLKTCKESR